MKAGLITLKVLVAIVLMASAPLVLKRRWRLFLAIPFAVFQGFVPWSKVAGVPIPLAFWGGLMLWPEVIREFKQVITWRPTAAILGIVVLYTVSLMWSPKPEMGLQPIGYFLQFLVIFSAVLTEGRRDEAAIYALLKVTIAFGLVQALSVIIFRIMPGLKLEFYLSSFAKSFISPNSLKMMFLKGQDNVLNPTKSAGMLGVNANFSATYFGILTFIALGLALQCRSKWLALVSLFLLGTIPFVGSKAGLVLAAVMPLLALRAVTRHYGRWRSQLRLVTLAVMLVAATAWLGPKAFKAREAGIYQAVGALLSRSEVTLSTREKIWAFAPQAFARHPFFGQGFGGWQQSIVPYARKVGLSQAFPPHNTIIYLWSQGGLLAALLGLAFMYQVMKLGWHQLRDSAASAFGLSMALTFGFAWTFVQGMGTNFGLLGEIHMSPILACLLALGYLQRKPTMSDAADSGRQGQNAYLGSHMARLGMGVNQESRAGSEQPSWQT